VNVGSNATFAVIASGTPGPAYQWRLNGTNIAGATATSYTRTNVQAADTGNYSVLVTNLAGSIVSSNALLALNAAPSISVPPQSQTVSTGQDATFSVTASGSAPLAYQWRFASANIAGATGSSYTRTNAQAGDAGNYSVVVTNNLGVVTSAVAALTVISSQPVVIAQWDFNSATPDATTTTGTLNPFGGAGTASYVGGTSPNGSGFATGSGVDPNTGDNSAWNVTNYPAINANNKSAGVKFAVSTAGRQNISVRWDQRVSNTGSKYARLQYTTDGTSFVDFQMPVVVGTAASFEAKTNNLAGISAVNNNTNFAFRIVAEFESTAITNANAQYVAASTGNTYAPNGSFRFDMVTVTGIPIPPSGPAAPATLDVLPLSSGQFRFAVTGSAGSNYVVQACTNFLSPDWTPLATNASPFTFTNTTSLPARFFRAIAQ
jgi:hypothetical protein